MKRKIIIYPYDILNQASKVPGYEHHYSMTDEGHRLFNDFKKRKRRPLFRCCNEYGEYQHCFSGIEVDVRTWISTCTESQRWSIPLQAKSLQEANDIIRKLDME